MNPIRHIRKEIFGVDQTEFALIAGVTQPTVSRWERGEVSPSLEQMNVIRADAAGRGIPWNDAWFFEAPAAPPQGAAAA